MLEEIKAGAKIDGKDGVLAPLIKQLEQKILALYALGNSYTQISKHIEDFYEVHFSKATISAVTDKVIPLLKESVYPFVWLDAIHYKIKESGIYHS